MAIVQLEGRVAATSGMSGELTVTPGLALDRVDAITTERIAVNFVQWWAPRLIAPQHIEERRHAIIREVRAWAAEHGVLSTLWVATCQLIAAGDPKLLAFYVWLAHETKELILVILEQYR